ncbi:MAG: preprotein translocase subunit SecY [Robiginitomaculum sp.]|nr:preprotein translocase subunit SecY [Robiginitomaculum sp.]
MASAAEQLAANMNFSAFGKAKELQQRIWFTIIILVVYRLGTYIPMPGINIDAYAQVFENQSGGLLGMINIFSGGAVQRLAVFTLTVMPYISASIIMQLMQATVPSLMALKKDGEAGRKTLNQYTRYLTVILAVVQAFSIAISLENSPNVVVDPGWFFRASAVFTLVSGTMFLMWLGEQVTARGVGNGISLIIFAGIVAALPGAVVQTLQMAQNGSLAPIALLVILVLAVGVILFIVFVERSQRRLLIQYPKRQQGNKMSGGESSFLPLKLNTPGVIPPIFASSLLLLPATIAGFSAQSGPDWLRVVVAQLGDGRPAYMALYAAGIIFFCFFYTSIVFNPTETADNLRKNGGFLPGIRPGERTANYLDYVLTRLTTIGALYLTAVCLMPVFVMNAYAVPYYLGGTSILIVVSVTMDTVAQIQSHLIAHQYEGLIKKSRMRGRRR